MELNDYQEAAISTCLPSSDNLVYMTCGLQEEVGELNGKIAKAIRKGIIIIQQNKILFAPDATDEQRKEFIDSVCKELGDVLWMVAGLSNVFGFPLEYVGNTNLLKLAARKAAGTINGAGDGISGADRMSFDKQNK